MERAKRRSKFCKVWTKELSLGEEMSSPIDVVRAIEIFKDIPAVQVQLPLDKKLDRDAPVWAVPEWFGEKMRGRLGLSQSKFASLLGISQDTLQNWEQGRHSPTGPAKVLLKIATKHPEVLLEVA